MTSSMPVRCPYCRSTSICANAAMNVLECDDCGKFFPREGYDNNLIDEDDDDDDE